MSYEKIGRNLKCILLRKRSQCEKAVYSIIPAMTSGKSKTMETVKNKGSRQVGMDQQKEHRIFNARKILDKIK